MTQDEEIAALRAENARLRKLVKKSLAAINSAYEEALANERGHDRTAGKVRVRIPVYLHGQGRLSLAMQYRPSKGWEDVVLAKSFVSLQRVAYITADIPLPQPVEIPGTVESGE